MLVLDFILNVFCLLLWLNWRSGRLASSIRTTGIALVGTLRRADSAPRERWSSSLILVVILLVRPVLYLQLGASTHWTPQISLGAFVLHFRSDLISRMVAYSLLNFCVFLAAFYFSLLLIVAVNRSERGPDAWLALARSHLGILSRSPAWLCLLLPYLITFVLWLAIGPLLAAMEIHLPLKSFSQLASQAAIVGLGGWLLWQYAIALIFILHVVSSYVYLGNAPVWKSINATARNLLRPISWLPLRFGKVDLAPVLSLGFIVAIVIFAPVGLALLYQAWAA